ncbi:MAG: tetratricopeptide repeat protein [Solidesulfovibrio sp. DCME]|uniref:tetratricopeptide repeat protein n=1 Tax=Solidesulfovibrio sp. DCME TaxID=3447380 RepID=UPI003D0EB37F
MVSKIELYREVLEIEPNSKVFFPLARLLAASGQDDEAAKVLARGIAFHPDHLEAKFLLIELLTRQGRGSEADAVFADVGGLLSRYPSVWLLWSRTAAARSKDPSLAMLFLANYFQNESLTWSEVMERGLRSLRQAEAAPDREAGAPPQAPVAAAADVWAAPATAAPATAAPVAPTAPTAPRDEAGGGESLTLRGAREVRELAADLLEAPKEAPEAKAKGRAGKGREAVVRTKTMAALLADQGDTAGARAIYEELLAELPAGAQRREIEALAAALEAAKPAGPPAASGADAPAAAPAAEPARKPGGPAKLVSLLEALAERLDARAGG